MKPRLRQSRSRRPRRRVKCCWWPTRGDRHAPASLSRTSAPAPVCGGCAGRWDGSISRCAIAARYLGPFWLTLSTGVMVGALGVLYSTLFQIRTCTSTCRSWRSRWCCGTSSSTLVGEACACFTSVRRHDPRHPDAVFPLCRPLRAAQPAGAAHNVIVIVVVFLIFSIWPGAIGAGGHAGPGAVAYRQPRARHPAGRVLRALPRHPADRRQRDADRLLRQPRSSGSRI